MNESFYMLVTALGTWAVVACALFAVWWQVRSSKQLASLQLFLQLHAQYESPYMQEKRARLAQKLLDNPQMLEVDDTILLFFETSGKLERAKYIDNDLVQNTFGYDVCGYWHALYHYAFHLRHELSDDTIFCEFEDLSKRMSRHKKWEEEAHSSAIRHQTLSAKQEFLLWETRRSNETNTKRLKSPRT
jgi:hypothetical protein